MWSRLILPLILFTAGLSGGLMAETPAKNKVNYQQEYRTPDRNILKGVEFLYDWEFNKAELIFQKYIKNNARPTQSLNNRIIATVK